MKNFNWTKYLIAVIAVYVVYEILDFLIHGVMLMDKYESLGETGLFGEDMDSNMWVIYITAFVFSIFFVYLFHYFVSAYKTGWMAGLYYGLVVGFLMLVSGVFNQYVVYGAPMDLIWQWFIFGVIQIAIAGVVAGLIYKPKAAAV